MPIKSTIISSLLYFCVWFDSVTACSEHAVRKAIFDGYVKELRPVKNQSTVTHINVQADIYNILSVNEQDEMIELLTWSILTWTDEFLQWNPNDFGGCERIATLASTIWIPDYFYYETLEIKDIGIDEYFYVHIFSNGTVVAIIPLHITLHCKMYIANFPFDTQTCEINSGSAMYTMKDIMIHKEPHRPEGVVHANNSEFEAVSYTCEETLLYVSNNEYFSELRFSLVLKRRPEYYIFVLLLPSFLLTMLCIIGIFAPNSSEGERNEKMTLGLTTLLSMAVILNITAEEMPKSSKGLPLLGYYIFYEIIVCSLSTIFSTVLIFIHERANRNHWNPPAIIQWIASIPSPLECLRWIKCSEKLTEIPMRFDKTVMWKLNRTNDNSILAPEKPTPNSSGEVNAILASLRHINFKIDEYLRRCDEEEERKALWASALNHIDLFLLVVFLIGNCALSAIILL